MSASEIIFFSPPPSESGVDRVRTDGGVRDVLYNLYKNQLDSSEVIAGYWEAFEGEILIDPNLVDEICFITEGSAIIKTREGEEKPLKPGDVIFIPKGCYAHWIIPERVKKVYMIVR